MIRAVARFVDRQRAAHQRLGFGVIRLRSEKKAKLIEQPRRRLRDRRRVRRMRDRKRMRGKRIEDRPASHIAGSAREPRVHPFQRLAQSLRPPLVAHRPAGKVLNEPMNDKARGAAVLHGHAGDERIGIEASARRIGVGIRRLAGNGDVEERIGNRIRREKGEPLEQPPARLGELRDRCRPGRGQRPIGARHRRIRPGERLLPALAPELLSRSLG